MRKYVSDESIKLHRAPGWVTSLGAFCALALAGINQQTQSAHDSAAQQYHEKTDTHLQESQRRLWDAINDDRKIFASFTGEEHTAREQLREKLREEILSDMRREFDVRFGEKHGR